MLRKFPTLLVALAASSASTVVAAEYQEGYLFSTGDEIVKLPEMVVSGTYGTLITHKADRWTLQTGQLDVRSKDRALSIWTSKGATSIPAHSKSTVVELNDTIIVAAQPDTTGRIKAQITQHEIGNHSRKVNPVQMILKDQCDFSVVAPYRVRWQRGVALIHAPSGMVADTNEGIVQAPPGSTFVLASSFGGVRLMSCSSVTPIKFILPDRQIIITPSEEVFVCNHRPVQSEVTPRDGVGRKAIKLTDLGRTTTAVTSQFSIPTMLRSGSYFKDWTKTGGSRSKISSHLLKTAAVVSFARKSPQSFYIAPRSNTF